jgi:arylsulfatase
MEESRMKCLEKQIVKQKKGEDNMLKYIRKFSLFGIALLAALALIACPAAAQQKRPNILVIWGDDIGQFNISAYNMGMMGYKTPNIDSIAKQGALFTDW